MNEFTPVITTIAATSDSPVLLGALMLTFVGIGTIVASFVMAMRQHSHRNKLR